MINIDDMSTILRIIIMFTMDIKKVDRHVRHAMHVKDRYVIVTVIDN